MTIAGAPVTIQKHWEIRAPANGSGVMRFDVLSKDGSYVPALDAPVLFVDGAVTWFGGLVQNVRERGAANDGHQPITTEVTAIDYNVLATRRYFGEPIPAGTLKAALTQLVPYLPGVTLDAAQVAGPALPAGAYGSVWRTDDILNQFTTTTGYIWRITAAKVLRMYTPGSIAAPFNIAAGDGHTVGDVISEPTRLNYANSILVYGTGVAAFASDAPEIAAHGLRELLVRSPDITVQADADALAAAVLAASLPIVKTVTYDTYGAGLAPGQTQSIVFPKRHLNNTFLITDVTSRDESPTLVRSTVTAIEGLVYQPGWREAIKQWGGAGGGLTIGGAGGGGVTFTRNVYFLGGIGADMITSPTPTWVPASDIQVQVNTIPRGTLSALVVVRLRAASAGVTVKARLFDVTANAACPGESAVVTNTAFQLVSFTSTLTAGSHLYRLEVLPGSANEPVAAVGYLE